MSTIDPSTIDPTKPAEGLPLTANVRANEQATQDNFAAAKADIEALEAAPGGREFQNEGVPLADQTLSAINVTGSAIKVEQDVPNDRYNIIANNATITQVGGGAELFIGDTGTDPVTRELRTVESGDDSISVAQTAQTIDIRTSGGAGSGQINSAQNIGGGVAIANEVNNGTLIPIRSLDATVFAEALDLITVIPQTFADWQDAKDHFDNTSIHFPVSSLPGDGLQQNGSAIDVDTTVARRNAVNTFLESQTIAPATGEAAIALRSNTTEVEMYLNPGSGPPDQQQFSIAVGNQLYSLRTRNDAGAQVATKYEITHTGGMQFGSPAGGIPATPGFANFEGLQVNGVPVGTGGGSGDMISPAAMSVGELYQADDIGGVQTAASGILASEVATQAAAGNQQFLHYNATGKLAPVTSTVKGAGNLGVAAMAYRDETGVWRERGSNVLAFDLGYALSYGGLGTQYWSENQAIYTTGGASQIVDGAVGSSVVVQDRSATSGQRAVAMRSLSGVFEVESLSDGTYTTPTDGVGGGYTGLAGQFKALTVDLSTGDVQMPGTAPLAGNYVLGANQSRQIGEVGYPATPTTLTGPTVSPTYAGNAAYYCDFTGSLTVNLDASGDDGWLEVLLTANVDAVAFGSAPAAIVGFNDASAVRSLILNTTAGVTTARWVSNATS